ncbi:MAG: sigma-70 family RNA polymerase sigma factor [Prevotella sp.]|jgi:RNA polymerase sigma-70 factor (ECF subfamily)|nr:sigma-70 family RNA polymerase sigma factor [Prevotella sp.]
MDKFAAMTDEELALQYVDGNNQAFDELLARNQQKLFNYIMFMVHNQEQANDIFQDTFVKIIVKLQQGNYTNSGKFSYWMTRIAHNVIMDWYRMQKGEHIVEPNADNDLSNLGGQEVLELNREMQLINSQIMNDVRHMMDSLPTAQREVVYMRMYQDLSFKEIAEITGVSINTALGRMRYAILNLRRMAKKHDITLNVECA